MAKSLQELVPYPITPKNAPRFAERIAATIKEMEKINLDFSVGSLRKVDKILED